VFSVFLFLGKNVDTSAEQTSSMLKNSVRKLSSFTYLNVTQFLGALNDNIYKLLIVYFLISVEGIQNSAWILAATGAVFVLPFLLFSASSGTLADRSSKRNIIIFTKILELLVMSLALLFFWYESVGGSYLVLFLLATQSAIFGPSKYGIIPELVPDDHISRANGLMTSFTFLAIILGTFLASFLLDITDRNYVFAACVCLFIAIAGFISSLCIEYTPPAGSSKRYNVFFLTEIFQTLKLASGQPSLLTACIGSAFFLFLGAFVQLNMIPFAVQSLHLTDIQGGYLFLLVALGIGAGAYTAGRISGKTVELALVPIAGVCVTALCYAIDMSAENLKTVIVLIPLLGFAGGMWAIPLDSYIQIASPNQYRGQMVAATNFLSFFGVLLASGLIYLINDVIALPSDTGFTIIGTITAIVTLVIGYQFFDYVTRFVGMLFSLLHFKLERFGVDNIPDTPAVYVCHHTAWNDTLILLGSQRRRMRFFIHNEQNHTKLMSRMYRMLKVYLLPDIEPLENNKFCLDAIKRTLKKGISVCIFVDNPHVHEEIEKLKTSYSYKEILEETPFPIVCVRIEKDEKTHEARFFKRYMAKIHVPARIYFGPIHAAQPKSEEECP
jgi:acyl-[acyl-carrier-protein]-phospholipid O-acyltransferase/long-chain-fatty-acid--[acyl-carrier-protein] ligase